MAYIRQKSQNVCIFGSGNFGKVSPVQASQHGKTPSNPGPQIFFSGSCLADHLADASHNVLLWSRSMAVVKSLNSTHTHPTCHKGHVFPETVRAVGPDLPMKEILDEMDVLVFAVPTEGLR